MSITCQLKKKEGKLPVFADDRITYMEKPRDSTLKLTQTHKIIQ